MKPERERIEDEIASLEMLAWMATDADQTARAKRFRARARKLRASLTEASDAH